MHSPAVAWIFYIYMLSGPLPWPECSVQDVSIDGLSVCLSVCLSACVKVRAVKVSGAGCDELAILNGGR